MVNLITSRMASTYSAIDEITKENFREKFMEGRRKYYEKQTELVSLFGEEFKARKCREIEEILKRHPYEDVMEPE